MKTSNLRGGRGRCSREILLAVAASASLLSSVSMAAIVTSPVANLPVPQTTAGVYINVVTGVTGTTPGAVPGWDLDPWGSTNLQMFWPSVPSTSTSGGVASTATGPYLVLAPGDTVGPASTFSRTVAATNPNFWVTQTGYMGFRFQNEATGQLNYGYMEISTTAATGFPATIISIVYENTGAAITIPSLASADISGTITNSLGGGAMSGITVANSGAPSTSTNGSGVFSFTGLAAGSYTITPSVYNYVFSPTSRTVNLAGVNATGQNFTGTYNGIPDITDLRALVVAANLTDTRVKNSLLAPLDAALVWLNGSNVNKVAYSCSNLAKFIAATRQNISVGKLPAATGNPWIVAANDILALSGCPTR